MIPAGRATAQHLPCENEGSLGKKVEVNTSSWRERERESSGRREMRYGERRRRRNRKIGERQTINLNNEELG